MSRKWKKSKFNVFFLNFLRTFHTWKIENVQLRETRFPVGFLKVNCSFTLEKSFKLTPNLSKKEFWQLFDKLLNGLKE